MRSIHLVTPGLPGVLIQPTADSMRQVVHLYGDDGNLIGENIGWVECYDGGTQWKGFTRHGALPFRRSRPDAGRDVLREWRIRNQPALRNSPQRASADAEAAA